MIFKGRPFKKNDLDIGYKFASPAIFFGSEHQGKKKQQQQ